MAEIININIRLPRSLVDKLDAHAEQHGFTRSEVARWLLAERLTGIVQLVPDPGAAAGLATMRKRGRPPKES
jgi:metal-responsive CopG/Arc/MetJ family transcriptional regulator